MPDSHELPPQWIDAIEQRAREAAREAVREALQARPDVFDPGLLYFSHAFQIAPLSGDYLEFGVFRGGTLLRAYRACSEWFERLRNGRADHLVTDRAALRARVEELWAQRRFFGFDSFEGMPEPQGVDRERIIWQRGTFASPLDQMWRTLDEGGVPREKIVAVKGFFDQTLTPENREALGIRKVAVAHIDSDLYESARLALEFVTPGLQNGTVVIFDEWFAYRGHPLMGEQRAFAEWRERHPEWLVTPYHWFDTTSMAFLLNHRDGPGPFRDHLAEILE